MQLFRKYFVSCHVSQCWWNNDMCHFSWCANTSINVPGVPKIQPQEFSSLDSSSFRNQLQQRQTDKKQNMMELCHICNVGNEDADHGVQGRDKVAKGIEKWKLIKPERSLCVPNYAVFSGWFLLYFDILIMALTLLLFVNFPKVG